MTLDYSSLSDEDLVDSFRKMDLNMVANVAANLPPEKAAYVVSRLEAESSDDASHRICSLFLGLTTKEQVTAVGKVMNTKFTMVLIQELIKRDTSHLWKISSLMIGLTHRVFLKVLSHASGKELELLQHEAMKEPMQHHLTVFIHESEEQINSYIDLLMEYQKSIETRDLEAMSYADVAEILEAIERFASKIDAMIVKLNRALGIGWNTNRPDLIDRLTKIKETCQRTLQMVIGTPRSSNSVPTGLYLLLENLICHSFNNNDPYESLRDDEPGVEALAKLSLWYMKDYWEAGLLPSINHEDQLKLDPEKHSDKECQEYRQRLMDEVNANLEKHHLSTVGDFRKAFIGTRKLLCGYLKN